MRRRDEFSGIDLYHFEQGSEGHDALILHGGPGIPPDRPWTSLPEVPGHVFHSYHQRGCGRSTHPITQFDSWSYSANSKTLDGALGMKQQLADIDRIRRLLGEQEITLIGHSYGAFLAVLYAMEYPRHVDEMILVSPADVLKLPSDDGHGMNAVRQALPPPRQEAFDDFLDRYFDYGSIFKKTEADLATLNSELGKFYVEALAARGVKLQPAWTVTHGIGGWMVHALYFSTGKEYDYRPLLEQVGTRTLIIHGAKDISAAGAKAYASLLPNAEVTVIPGASHFAFEETPNELAATVRKFLAVEEAPNAGCDPDQPCEVNPEELSQPAETP